MAGSAPVVSVTLDNASYKPGFQAIATATISDADNVTETLNATDALGRQVSETLVRTDRADVLWRWQGGATLGSGFNPFAFITPTRPAVLECVVTDGQGNQTITAVEVPVVVPPSLRVGLCCPPSERAAHLSLFPGPAWLSSYSPPGSGLPAWKGLRSIPTGTTPWVRFKDDPTVALLVPWLDAMPADVPEVMLTHHHEPKVTDDSVKFRDAWVRLRQTLNAHPNGHRVRTCVAFMLWQLRHEGFDPAAYWPIMPDGSPAAESVGADCYSSLVDGYEPPESLFKVPLAVRDLLGVPLHIPEFGSLRVASDADGTGRGRWIRDCVAFLTANGVAGACWYCAADSRFGNFHLDAFVPEAAAWAGAIRATTPA